MSCLCRSSIWKGSWFLPGCSSRVAYPALAGQEFIVPGLFGVSVSGAKQGKEFLVCGGFFPTSAVPAWPIFIWYFPCCYDTISLLEQGMYLFTWSGLVSIPNFPLKKKSSLRFKVIFESVWIFLSGWKKKKGDLRPHGFKMVFFFSGLRAKFWAPLGGVFMLCRVLLFWFFFFLRDLGRVNDIIYEQTIWVVSYCWHIAQESKQTRMCCKHREREKHHYLGKSEHLNLGLLGQKCDFLLCEPRWGRIKPAKLCTQTCSVHCARGHGRVSVPLDENFGTLWKILGTVALVLSLQWVQDDGNAHG